MANIEIICIYLRLGNIYFLGRGVRDVLKILFEVGISLQANS